MSDARLQRSLRTTLLGMVLNLLLAVGKMAAGILGHSHALIADGVESLADIFSSLIVWRGLVVAAEPADEDHPYGHGKAEPIAAACVAGMLMIAALWITLEAIREIITPHSSPAPFTLVVLVGVIVLKEWLFQHVLSVGNALESMAVRSDAFHHRSDAITSLAALIGITVAVVGGKGYEAADDVAAIFGAAVISFNAARIFRPAVNELMDTSPDPKLIHRIRTLSEGTAGVKAIEKCLVRKVGHNYFVDMHVQVDPEISVKIAHGIAHDVKNRVRAEIPAVRDVLVHLEPVSRVHS